MAAIDDANLGKKLGDYHFYQLSELFYAKIMSDPSGTLTRIIFILLPIYEHISQCLTATLGKQYNLLLNFYH